MTAFHLLRRNRQRIRKTAPEIIRFQGLWSEWGDLNTQPRHPKCRALPVEPHPVIHFSAMIPRRGVKIKIFLSVVIPVVKAAFMLFSAIGGNPANAGVTRICGVSPHPIPDTATALPNQARYQLRYTRILNDLMGMDPPEATRRRALHTIPVHYNTPAAKREAYSYPFFFDGKTLT